MTIRAHTSGMGLDQPSQAKQSCVCGRRRDRHRPTTISGTARPRPKTPKIPAAGNDVSAVAASSATRYTVPVATGVANPVPNAVPNRSEWPGLPNRLQPRGTIQRPEGGRREWNRTGLRSRTAATTTAAPRSALTGNNPPTDCDVTPTRAPAVTAPRAKAPGPPRRGRNHGFASLPTGDVITWIEFVPHGEYVASQPESAASINEVHSSAAGPAKAQPTAAPTNGSRYNLMPFATPDNRCSYSPVAGVATPARDRSGTADRISDQVRNVERVILEEPHPVRIRPHNTTSSGRRIDTRN